MKRFVWRLQRVLDIRRKEEEIKRVQLLETTEKLAQTRGELLMQKTILEDIIDGLTREDPETRLGRQEFFLRCSATNDELIKKLSSKVNELEARQKENIAEILTVKRAKKGLERLRVEAKMQFIKEQEKLEQKEADEMTIIGFARKIMQRGKIGDSTG